MSTTYLKHKEHNAEHSIKMGHPRLPKGEIGHKVEGRDGQN